MLLAQDVLHAYTIMSISIMVVFTSLTSGKAAGTKHEKNEQDASGLKTQEMFNGT